VAEKYIVIDTSICTACRGCQTACKQWNNLAAEVTENRGSYENPPDLSRSTYTKILFNEMEKDGGIKWYFGQKRCMHCADAGCAKACPVPGAIVRDSNGAVLINQAVCTGCKYCVFGCPFDIPRYDSANAEGAGVDKAYKCTMCFDRQSMGMEPACTKTCPTGALSFASKSKLAAITASAKEKGLTVYDGGPLGTGVVFLLEDSPSAYGLPAKPAIPTPTYLWRTVMKPVGVAAFAVGILAAIYHLVAIGVKEVDEEPGPPQGGGPSGPPSFGGEGGDY
jgi:formate dehydrogenase iron-sulfur subunit